jgi:hypothetical protein
VNNTRLIECAFPLKQASLDSVHDGSRRMTIPQAVQEVIESAVHAAVKEGTLWLTSGPASIFG